MLLEPAYILHRYPYQEKSFLLKIFSHAEGSITLVARNAKRAKSNWYSLLQPFQKLNITYQGKGSVMTLKEAERNGNVIALQGRALFAGFYLNELLLRLLPPHVMQSNIFNAYEQAITKLATEPLLLEPTLRKFELHLFEALGLLPDLMSDETEKALIEQSWYALQKNHQPQAILAPAKPLIHHFQGFELIAIRDKKLQEPHLLKCAKRFTRLWLQFYHPEVQLQTREVFATVFHEA